MDVLVIVVFAFDDEEDEPGPGGLVDEFADPVAEVLPDRVEGFHHAMSRVPALRRHPEEVFGFEEAVVVAQGTGDELEPLAGQRLESCDVFFLRSASSDESTGLVPADSREPLRVPKSVRDLGEGHHAGRIRVGASTRIESSSPREVALSPEDSSP